MDIEPEIPDGEQFVPAPYAISYNAFIATIWTTASLALLFVALRLYARIRGPGKLFADDVFIVFALVILIVTGALWHWAARDIYTFLDLQARRTTHLPEDWQQQFVRYNQVWSANQGLYYTALTMVKLSLLLFFRRLGYQTGKMKKVWWPLVAYVVAALIIAVACTPWDCALSSTDNFTIEAFIQFTEVCNGPKHIKFVMDTYKVSTALDVSSDFFIMLVPVLLVWDLRMPLKKKISFVGLFSLTLVVMVIAIVRIVGASKTENRQIDPTYVFLWGSIEMCIAVMVACLSAFPQLFMSPRSHKPSYQPSQTFIERVKARAILKNGPSTHMITNELTSISIHKGDNFHYVSVPETSKTTASIHPTQVNQVPLMISGREIRMG
ncbi:hypothetical protein QBC44DRAFT_405940 [Cladorrhinum sp. PSN332]|nr:hypothetical protein QBC44DRAFT_405940 [Cladorrhinum sp. PSN332]